MRANFGGLSLVPDGLVAEDVIIVGETMVAMAWGETGEACCPLAGRFRFVRSKTPSIGRSRRGLTSKSYAVIDANGLPGRAGGGDTARPA